jgi:hypothetical protein
MFLILHLKGFEGTLVKSHLFEVNNEVQIVVVHNQDYILN